MLREKTILVSERSLLFVVGGQLFDQAPNRQPRKAEIIMQKLRDKFRGNEATVNQNEYYYIRIDEAKFYDFIKDTLFSIPEFEELNLSQIEYEKGVSVHDESRPKYTVTTAYDKYNEESWRHDFIDLDAFVGNVVGKWNAIHDADCDCFLCVNQPTNSKSTLSPGESSKCMKCVVNPDMKNNYEGSREPKGKYTFSCKFDCFKSKYICCEECDDKEQCKHRCSGESESCGSSIKKKPEGE